MKNIARMVCMVLGGFGVVLTAISQSPCPSDSLALNVTVDTDDWGYEAYWELLPAEGACGDGTALLWGGNSEVGCSEDLSGLESEILPDNVLITSSSSRMPPYYVLRFLLALLRRLFALSFDCINVFGLHSNFCIVPIIGNRRSYRRSLVHTPLPRRQKGRFTHNFMMKMPFFCPIGVQSPVAVFSA